MSAPTSPFQKILIADNDKYFTTLLGNALREHHLEVLVAQDGIDAFNKARSNEPHCLLVDLQTPKYENERLCRNFKKDKQLAQTPIVLLTTLSPGALSEEIIAYSDAILLKEPADQTLSKILSVIENLSANGTRKSFVPLGQGSDLQNLQNQQQKLESELAEGILGQLPMGIVLTQANGQLIYVNRYAQEMLEKNVNQLLGKHLEHVLPGAQFSTLAESTKNTFESASRVFYGKRLLGVICRGFKESMHPLAHHLFIITDETQEWSREQEQGRRKKSLEHEIEQQTFEVEKANVQLKEVNAELQRMNHMKSEFLANMSHELRSPLNDILGFTQLLQGRTYGEITPRQDEAIGLVSESALVLLNLINGILDYSKLEAREAQLDLSAINLAEMLQEIEKASRHLIRGRPVKIRMDLAADLPILHSDREKLRQIITNLLHNAIKFTKRGSIKISARNIPQQNQFEVAIEDTGIGIAKKDLKIIFEAFRQVDGSSTREFEGTGLGLAITTKLLNLLSGGIAVSSTPGVGSTFRILLPHTIESKGEA